MVTSNSSSIHLPSRLFSKKSVFSFICIGILSLSAALFVVFSSTPPHAHADAWTQIWDDEFNGATNTAVDAQWQYDLGTGYGCAGCANWGTGEIETATNSTANVYQDGNGHLVIKALNNNGVWTSGRIETVKSSFAAPAGGELEVTASLQQPDVSGSAALGYWPAFWMLGSAFRGVYTNWPGIGEVDMMEDINGLSSEYGTFHCGTTPGGPCNEPSGIGSGQLACSGCQTGYHTYTAVVDRSITPEQIRWYLDGNQIFSVSASQVDATTWANAVDHSFFLILDLAMGGAFPNGVCGCTSPSSSTTSGASMNVDYVRVYATNGSANLPLATSSQGTLVQAINAGGSASGNFASDADYNQGNTYSDTATSINTNSVGNPAPQAVWQSCRWNSAFTYTIPGLTAGTLYTVDLDWAELTWTAAGQRKFNVAINGTQVLSAFDVDAAGGYKTAVQRQFTTVANSSGQIVIAFTQGGADNPFISGIEIWRPTAGTLVTALNAGGSATGNFTGDNHFNQGNTYSDASTAITTSGVSNPAPQAVWQSCRWGASFTYAIPGLTAGALYTVDLDWAELTWTAAGQRKFNVAINGSQILSAFDVYAAGGYKTAVQRTFTATANSSGQIVIAFTQGGADNPFISGIEIYTT